jgi:hypothetical protein
MAYLCSQWKPNIQIKHFMFERSNYRLFVLNFDWKRDSLQIMIFVYVSTTWSIVELKTLFETWITKNDVNGVSSFRFLFFNTYCLHVLTMDIKSPNELFYVWWIYRLFVKKWMETWVSPNIVIRMFPRHET